MGIKRTVQQLLMDFNSAKAKAEYDASEMNQEILVEQCSGYSEIGNYVPGMAWGLDQPIGETMGQLELRAGLYAIHTELAECPDI